MTVPAEDLRNIFAELLVEAAEKRERREHIKEIKDRLKREGKEGIDWGQMRALAVAHDADQNPREGDTKKHVAELIEKRGYAEAYADIVLRVHVPEPIRQNRSSSLRGASTPTGEGGRDAVPNRCEEASPAEIPQSAPSSTVASPRDEEACGEPALDTPSSSPASAGSTNSADDPLNCIPPGLQRPFPTEARTQ